VLIQYLWFAFGVILLIFLWRTNILSGIAARTTKVSGFGLDFEFSEASARETRDSVESSLAPVRTTIVRQLEADVRAYSIQQVFASILDEQLGAGRTDYRATVHIPDPLFENWLYQLVDYHPKGAGHGRSFDSRGGLIGLAWRIGTTQPLRQKEEELTVDELVQRWGMTRREAAVRKTDGLRSLLAVVLHDQEHFRRIGVLYLDSTDPHRFGTTVSAMRERAPSTPTWPPGSPS